MSEDRELERRLRTQVSLLGWDSLNELDKWRWRTMQQEREQRERRNYSAEIEQAQQQYADVIAAMENWATWIKAELETLRAKQDQIIAETNKAFDGLGEIYERQGREDAQRDDKIRELKGQIAELRTKAAEARVEELNVLHGTLVRSAELSMKSFEQAAQRAELSTAEWEQVIEAGNKTRELADELQRLREAQRNFKFAREEPDDFTTLPNGYLPGPRRH